MFTFTMKHVRYKQHAALKMCAKLRPIGLLLTSPKLQRAANHGQACIDVTELATEEPELQSSLVNLLVKR